MADKMFVLEGSCAIDDEYGAKKVTGSLSRLFFLRAGPRKMYPFDRYFWHEEKQMIRKKAGAETFAFQTVLILFASSHMVLEIWSRLDGQN